MKLVVLTADAAQTDPVGKVHAIGLGWSAATSPLSQTALVIIIDLDPDEKARDQYRLIGHLHDAEGKNIHSANGRPIGFELTMQSEQTGDSNINPLAEWGVTDRLSAAITLPAGLKLGPGRYEWRVSVPDHGVDGVASFGIVPAGVANRASQ